MKDVAVIGAGFAGLAAAVELVDAGRRVVLYEAARHAGGRARRVEIGGNRLDNGQHILLGAYRETLRLIERVAPGFGAKALLRQPLRVHRPGAFLLAAPRWPAPLHLVAALLAAQGVSLGERCSALTFALKLKLQSFQTDPALTAEELLASQPGSIVKELWEPLCLAALNTPLRLASAQVFLNVLKAAFAERREDSDFLLPRVDLGRLFPEPALDWLVRQGAEIRRSEPVRQIASNDGVWILTGDAGERAFQEIVLAVAPQNLGAFATTNPDLAKLATSLEQIGYQPIHTLYFQFSDQARLPEPILALDGAPGQWLLDRGLLCGTPGLMAMVISGDLPPPYRERKVLEASAQEQIERSFPALGAPRWLKALQERRATYACVPGRNPVPLQPAPGLYLAGDYCYTAFPGTLEAAVRSGVAAARNLLAQTGRA